jgi:hypothetical protein
MHILIIRPGAIGDTLLTFPVIQALRAHYDNPRITLVSNPAVLPLAIKFGLAEEVSDYGQLQWSEIFASAGIQQPTLSAQLRQVDLAICWLRDSTGIVKHNLSMAGVKNVVVAPGRPPAEERRHIVDYLARSIGLGITDKRFHPVGAGEVGTGSGDPCGPLTGRFFANIPGKRPRPRRGGRGWDVAWGSVSGGDDIPCGRPRPCRSKDEGRPQGSPPFPSPPPPLRGRGAFSSKNLPV